MTATPNDRPRFNLVDAARVWAFRFGRLLPLVLVLVSPGCGAPGGAGGTARSASQPVAVTVTDVKSRSLRRTVPVFGTLHAYDDVMLAPKVDGRVLRIYKSEGEVVYPGEVLLELDPTDYRLAVEQARASLEAELRKLKLRSLPGSDEAFAAHVPMIDSVAQARANLELAEKEAARAELEASKGVGSSQALDTARTRVKVARTGLELAETEARVTLAHARRLQAALSDAEEKLRETLLSAPVPESWAVWSAVTGVAANPVRYSVASRLATQGAMISPMRVNHAFRLVLDHVLKLRVPVPEKYRPEILVGQAVEVRVEAYPGVLFRGTVARIFPVVDATNRTFLTEIEVPNVDRKLTAGGFARADIVRRTDDSVLSVPPEAVVSFAGTTKVFRVEGGVARAVEVEVGTREKDWVEVRGELQPGAKVAVSGQSQLVDGSPVRVR